MKKKEPNQTELIYKFSNLTLASQTLANIIEIYQNISRAFIFYLAASRVLFAHLTPAWFFSRGIFRTP